MKQLAAFGRFWWDFVIGDDWLVAALVIVAIGVTAALAATVSRWCPREDWSWMRRAIARG